MMEIGKLLYLVRELLYCECILDTGRRVNGG